MLNRIINSTILFIFCLSLQSFTSSIGFNFIGYGFILVLVGFLIYRILKNRLLLQSKLLNEEKEAERLKEMNRFKTRLYTNITYEFRTPLTVILGLSDEINENVENLSHEKIRNHHSLITSNGKSLLHLVNQILDLSKLESSNLSIKLVQADIIGYLKYIVESFSAFADFQKINLSFKSDIETQFMDFDKDMILKIVSNLISNAIKYTNEGGKVQLQVELGNNQNIIFKVSDTGTGIPKEAVPFIFDRFFQATTEQLQKQIGTGIGLSLTRELVNLFEGKISVESQLGIGTKFTVELPIKNEALAEVKPNALMTIQDAVDAYTIWPENKTNVTIQSENENDDRPTLLIIEDNNDIITYLKTILDPIYQLEIASNGKIGVEIATETIPDIVLSDVMMPLMDGFEVCNFLKNDERTSHIPIVLLTARSEIESKLHGLERGADAYISKPFNKNELLIRLEKLIQLRKKLQQRYEGFNEQPVSEEIDIQIEDAFISKLKSIVEKHIDDSNFGIQELCRAVKLSRMQVHRKLKALSGKTTSHFIRSIRLQKAKQLLLTSKMNVSEVAYEVGFNDPNYFSRSFNQEFGVSPSQFVGE